MVRVGLSSVRVVLRRVLGYMEEKMSKFYSPKRDQSKFNETDSTLSKSAFSKVTKTPPSTSTTGTAPSTSGASNRYPQRSSKKSGQLNIDTEETLRGLDDLLDDIHNNKFS